jgi:YebC/PmpR family DNA-binding regulatory protein
MSGHSKWSTIKRKKEAEDQKRGAVFTKLAKAIIIAAQTGGSPDPEMNFSLNLAVDRAKAANMPKENIQRAIDRGSGQGEGSGVLKEVVYEGFGPQKVAILVEVLTDNTNRTVSEIKKIFETKGGSLASANAVAYLFEKVGLLLVVKGEDPETTMLQLIDLGAEDIEEVEDGIEVYVPARELAAFKEKFEQKGIRVKEMEIARRPKTTVVLADQEKAKKVLALMEALNNHDDVQKTWANLEIPAN